MKLYFHPVSNTSRPVMMFLQEAGIDCEMQVVDLMTGEHHQPPYADHINPNRLVPALEDGDFVLTESSAILKYLADKVDSPLYPKDLQARARVNERMDWFNTQFFREYGYHVLYPQVFDHHKRPGAINDGTIEWGATKARDAMQVLNDWVLGDNAYVCGDTMTIADIQGADYVAGGEWIGTDFSKWPNIDAWLKRIKAETKAWDAVHEVHDGFAASLAGNDFVTV